MRRALPVICASSALVFILLVHVSSAPADANRELIVQLTRPRLGASTVERDAQLASRLDALGLRVTRRLGDGLPAASAGHRPPANPFEVDPAYVILVAAADSLGAEAARRALAADPLVAWVEPNAAREPAVERITPMPVAPGPLHEAASFPNDPMFNDTRQWGLMNLGADGVLRGVAGADIHARAAWERSVGGNHITLAIADTGVDPAQPELQAVMPEGGMRMTLGRNVTGEPVAAWADSFGHGTPVASVMAARTNDGARFDSLGMAGVCGGDGSGNFGCRLVPIKIAPGRTGAATSFDIAQAIYYATAVGARAVNLSFAGGGPSRFERLAMLHAITHGCVVVAAAGNRGARGDGRAPQYPAAYAADGLGIQVGATDAWDARAPWSSLGPGLDLVAPGTDIWGAWMTYVTPGGAVYPGYAMLSGTSFAAPFATGTIGLLAAARPELMDADFQHLLRENADDVGAPGPDVETGWGRLNAAEALDAVRAEIGIWHDEVAGATFTSAGFDTLRLGEPGPGTFERVLGPLRVERIEVTATVAIPDSFTDSVRVWPRVGGTMTTRGDFSVPYFTPWADVERRDARSFMLRGYIYRAADSTCVPCGEDPWLPLPPDQARFGFTVMGRVTRPSPLDVAKAPPPRRIAAPLRVTPNPFRASTRIAGPAGARITIFDTAGRIVRRGVVQGGTGVFSWDGRDARGRSVPIGLYFVSAETSRARQHARAVRIE